MYKQAFLLAHSRELRPKIQIDAYLQVNWGDPEKLEAQLMLLEFAREEEGDSMPSEEHAKFLRGVSGMMTRATYGDYIGGGVLLVNTSEPWSQEKLEGYLRSLSDERLQEFINESSLRGVPPMRPA